MSLFSDKSKGDRLWWSGCRHADTDGEGSWGWIVPCITSLALLCPFKSAEETRNWDNLFGEEEGEGERLVSIIKSSVEWLKGACCDPSWWASRLKSFPDILTPSGEVSKSRSGRWSLCKTWGPRATTNWPLGGLCNVGVGHPCIHEGRSSFCSIRAVLLPRSRGFTSHPWELLMESRILKNLNFKFSGLWWQWKKDDSAVNRRQQSSVVGGHLEVLELPI